MTVIVGLAPTSDDELEALGRLNPGWSFERDDHGRILMSPTHSAGGAHSAEALLQLGLWRERIAAAGKIFDSSTGFTLSTGAVRSPDASWLSQERIDAMQPEERSGFWRICPNVTIEVASETDDWETQLERIERYLLEGARYAEPPAGLQLDFDAIIDA